MAWHWKPAIVGCVWFIYRKMELRYWLEPGNVKNNRINYLNEKRSLIPWGLRVPIWKINFCSRVLRLSVHPCRERPQTTICLCCLEWLGRLKCLATSLDAFLSSFSTSRRCSRNLSPSRLPVSPMYNFMQSASYTVDDIGWGTGKMISDLNGSLWSRQFLNVANKRTC